MAVLPIPQSHDGVSLVMPSSRSRPWALTVLEQPSLNRVAISARSSIVNILKSTQPSTPLSVSLRRYGVAPRVYKW